jgi:hypothetical protein
MGISPILIFCQQKYNDWFCCQFLIGKNPDRSGNNILKSLKPEYVIIKQNAGRKAYANGFPVHVSQ